MRREQYAIHAELGISHWWHYGTKMFFLQLIHKTLPGGAHILDTGCGVGDMIALLKRKYDVTGIDCSKEAIKYCLRKKIGDNVLLGDINNMPFESKSFDGILSLDVLYHAWVRDDLQVLQEMSRLLKPGGILFLQLPAYNWLRSSHDEWSYTARRYTAKQVKNLLNTTEFTIRKLGYRVCFLLPIAIIQRKIVKSKHSDMKAMNPLSNALFRLIISFENFLSLYVNFPFGLSVIAIAEKEGK